MSRTNPRTHTITNPRARTHTRTVTRSDAMDNKPQWCDAGAHNTRDVVPLHVPDGTLFGRRVMVCQRCMKEMADGGVVALVPALGIHVAVGRWPTRSARPADVPAVAPIAITLSPHHVRMLRVQGYDMERSPAGGIT